MPSPSRPRWPALLDAAIAAFFLVLVLVEAFTNDTVENVPLQLAATLPAMAAIAWRRQYPVLVAALMMVVNLVTDPDGQFSTLLAMVLLSFTIGHETVPPRRTVGLLVILVPFMGAMVASGLEPSDVAAAMVFIVGPWTVGIVVRQRTAEADAAQELADQAVREQTALAAAAAAEERVRLARELHDVVSHSISVVTVQTQAVRRRLGPEHQREIDDLLAVEITARDAMAELRRLFGVLRTEGQGMALEPQPGLGELDRLVEQVRATGLQVSLVRDGVADDLPPGLGLAAYRIVQEALTNALRHSGASAVAVHLRQDGGTLDIRVEDDGRGLGSSSGGHGITGIRERAQLYGGRLEVGPSPAGGVLVAATLPVGVTA